MKYIIIIYYNIGRREKGEGRREKGEGRRKKDEKKMRARDEREI